MKTIKDYIQESKQSFRIFSEAKHSFRIKSHLKKSDQGKDYVDFGLPSGLKWATCNIGANSPEDNGLLFQWGRVNGYKYNDKNHNFLNDKDIFKTSSNTEYKNGDALKPEDDAAYQATNGEFRMPTYVEIEELFENSEVEWITQNGVNGVLLTSKINNKTMFIPEALTYHGKSGNFLKGFGRIYLWTANFDVKKHADGLMVYNKNYSIVNYFPYHAFPIRAVLN